MKYDIIAIGSATQDVFLSVADAKIISTHDFSVGQGICLPFGSKVPAQKLIFASGGGGTNAAVTLARQGFRTACIGMIGDDPNGKSILDELRRESVDGKYMQLHSDDSTAYSVVLVALNGERTIVSYKGEGARWQPDTIPWDRLESSWMYINSLGGSIEMLEACIGWAQKRGVHIATNPGGAELAQGLTHLAPSWKHADIVGMNQEEAALLTGLSYDHPEEIFRTLDETIGGICIMTKGPEGVLVSDGHYIYSAPAASATVVERTGAGDAFHSGFLASFIRAGSIERAIQEGSANAASVTTHYGAKEGILRADQLDSISLVPVTKRAL